MNSARYYIILLIVMFSCSPKQTGLHSFENNHWNFQDPIIFDFEIHDTIQESDLLLFFRSNLHYPYRNLFLFMELHCGNTIITQDTLEYLIADKYGKWLGKGLGNTRDNYFMVSEKVIFKKRGLYKLILKHGMRQNPLAGCGELGFKIQ